jgi:hypothetical protein
MLVAYVVLMDRYFDLDGGVHKALTVVIECEDGTSQKARHKKAFAKAFDEAYRTAEFEDDSSWFIGKHGGENPGQCIEQLVLIVNPLDPSDSGTYAVEPRLMSASFVTDRELEIDSAVGNRD